MFVRPDPAPPQTDWRRAAGYALAGLGGSALGLAFILLRVVFLPSRHSPPMAAFSIHHPVAIICGCAALLGAPLLGLGVVLIKGPKDAFRIFDDGPPPSEPDDPQRRLKP